MVQGGVIVIENCWCDSHHAYIQVIIINLHTITCFGDVSILNIILYCMCAIHCSVVPANTHEMLACTLMHTVQLV